ncbi:MAG TPA: class I SAM-dependent methyltransferase [Steroidobacteraceae bacterium]|jgi:2-polyprenyl-6-hydroxyphenyl methylase/3-demethylubiquinone-9 3-methyltransferase|nr:class I SAM-dependent methyltransferase [Steroidobacteraceae bacterium]
MTTNSETTDVSTHYQFGKNWARFARVLTPAHIASAEHELERLVGAARLAGVSMLDVGSGSGLHSLAALNLGARCVEAVDFDPDSVKTTTAVLSRHATRGQWTARAANVLTDFADAQQRYDLVYSWGVLHHTGAMWQAIGQAARLVRPGGWFAIALYNKTPLCGLWRIEKRIFAKLPRFLQALLAWATVAAWMLGKLLRLKNPIAWYRDYQQLRGMSVYYDVHDWLGGYPYESVDCATLVSWMRDRGFTLVYDHNTDASLGLLGGGCGEYLFQRD